MKKVITLLMVLVIVSTAVFATPVSAVAGFQPNGSQSSWEVSPAGLQPKQHSSMISMISLPMSMP
jgi:hypothetical protein